MSTHHHINYIELPAPDMAAMKVFYSEVFGWSYQDYGPQYAEIKGAGIEGGLDANSGARGPSDQGALVIFLSEDLDASLAAVVKAGGRVTVPIFEFPGGRRFHFTDPCGNELAIYALD